ncbi:hydrogenase [Deferribacter autotrophicus]|uniref:Hydrogenase n=1 Tax=Deferribacter autotrophicus TaxID=500465 RepID=A0A5A8F2D9_9BACT|nr:proton-conducting transporter membrane subunit [Deferribacter autotrophicus]KAA0258240.1 hydrogenase [Deferribacter autotrophicus]
MNVFFLPLFIIFVGGVLPLFLYRKFVVMKLMSIALIGAGSFMGVLSALIMLMHGDKYILLYKYFDIFPISFKGDSLSAFFMVVIYSVSVLSVIYSFHYMDKPEKAFRTAVNYFFYSLLIISMVLVVNANNIITFAFSWEIMSLSSYFLVIYDYQNVETRKAGYTYLIFTHIGAMLIFAAFGVIYAFTGELGFEHISSIPFTAKVVVFLLSFAGFGSKAGIFPLHTWLPYAHPAAPSHISAVMSGVMIKMGIYGIVKMYSLLDTSAAIFGYIVLIFGVTSGVLGVVYALGQHDLKKLLAYHSVENIGIILAGIGIGMIGVSIGNSAMSILGFTGGLLHVLNHSIFKSLLFMGAGSVLHKAKTKSIEQLGGLLKNMKITGITFLIGSLAISGLPPFNGFISEFLIYIGSFKGISHNGISYIFSILAIISLAVIGGLASACFTKVVGIVFLGEPRSQNASKALENGFSMLIPMVILAIICIGIGVFPEVFVNMAFKGVQSLQLVSEDIQINDFLSITGRISFIAVLFFIILIFILIFRTLVYKGKNIIKTPTWDCGFSKPTFRMQYTGSSYASSIINFYKPFAPIKEDFNEIKELFPKKTHYHSEVIDIAEKYIIQPVVKQSLIFFDRLRWIQHGNIQLYIGYILLAIVVLLLLV